MEFKKIDFHKDKFSQLTTEKDEIKFLTAFVLDLINTAEIDYSNLLHEEIDYIYFRVVLFIERNNYKRNSTEDETERIKRFIKQIYESWKSEDKSKQKFKPEESKPIENETFEDYFTRLHQKQLTKPLKDFLECRLDTGTGRVTFAKTKIAYKVFLEVKRELIKRGKNATTQPETKEYNQKEKGENIPYKIAMLNELGLLENLNKRYPTESDRIRIIQYITGGNIDNVKKYYQSLFGSHTGNMQVTEKHKDHARNLTYK